MKGTFGPLGSMMINGSSIRSKVLKYEIYRVAGRNQKMCCLMSFHIALESFMSKISGNRMQHYENGGTDYKMFAHITDLFI